MLYIRVMWVDSDGRDDDSNSLVCRETQYSN